MVWGVIRLAIFVTGFLVGLLISNSGRHSESVHNWAQIHRESGETTCGANRFVLTDVQHHSKNAATHPSGM